MLQKIGQQSSLMSKLQKANLHLGVFKCVVLKKHYCTSYKVKGSLYHVPEEVGHPVHQWTDTTDKLQVFGLGYPLLD